MACCVISLVQGSMYCGDRVIQCISVLAMFCACFLIGVLARFAVLYYPKSCAVKVFKTVPTETWLIWSM